MKANLRKTIANVSQNKRVRAVALEVINGKASVRIAGSSKPLYGLPITGGDVVAGQEVYVDYTTGQPVVHSYKEDSPTQQLATRVRTRFIIPDPDVPKSGSDHTHTEAQILDLSHNAIQIRGKTVTTGSPVGENIMVFDALANQWQYSSGSRIGPKSHAEVDNFYLQGYDPITGLFSSGSVISSGITTGSTLLTASIQDSVVFTINDDIETGLNPLKIYNRSGATREISGVFLSIASAPDTGAIVIDILKNGTSIFEEANKPQIPSGSSIGVSYNINTPVWTHGEYLTMNIDDVGTVLPGTNLVVQVMYSVSNIPVQFTGIALSNPNLYIVDQCFFPVEGDLSSGSSPLLIYNTTGSNVTISEIFAYVNTPSSGSDIAIDIVKSGSSIFSSGSNMVSISSGSNIGQANNINLSSWADGEWITIDVKEAGTGAKDLLVQVIYSKNASVAEAITGITDHTLLSNIGTNTHDDIDLALERLAETSGSNTGDQDLSGYLVDASSDGKTYGRKDGSWAEITSSGSGGGIEEAPVDGKQYARKNAGWEEVVATTGSSITSGSTVAARYTTGTSGSSVSFANEAMTIVNFMTRDFDTHDCVTTGSGWKFQPSEAGYYRISAFLFIAPYTTWAATEHGVLYLYKNGNSYSLLNRMVIYSTSSTPMAINGMDLVYLNGSTDYIDIRFVQNSGGTVVLDTNSTYASHVSIEKVGVVQSVISSGSSGVTELSDLTDVDTAGATDGQALVWDNDTSTWVPATVSTSSGTDVLMTQIFT